MENTITIDVLCKDDSTKEKYSALAVKMTNDTEFKSKLNLCKEDEELYNLYKEYGYTDLELKDFIVQFKASIKEVVELQPKETFELTQEELECIVGGLNFYRYFTALISAIPVNGPFISGVSKAFKDAREGKDISGIIRQMIFGKPAVVNIRTR